MVVVMRVRDGHPQNAARAPGLLWMTDWRRLPAAGSGPSTEAPYGVPPDPMRGPSGEPRPAAAPRRDDDQGDGAPARRRDPAPDDAEPEEKTT